MKQTSQHIVLVLACSGVILAQEQLRPAERERATIEAGSPRIERQTIKARGSVANARIERRGDGALLSATGFVSRRYPGTKVDAARAFLSEYPSLLEGVDVKTLAPLTARNIGRRAYVRLQQQIDGIPLRGAYVVVRLSPANEVESMQSRLTPHVVTRGQWSLDSIQAVNRATAGMNANGVPRAERLYVVRNSNTLPVWRVLFRSGNPTGDWEVLISAEDGSVISKRDLRMGFGAIGNAYPKNPVTGNVEQVALEGLDSENRLTGGQTKVFTYLPALRGQVAPGTVVQGAARHEGNFLYPADDARFSEVQLYYGMQSANERFQGLGFYGFETPLPGVVLFQDYDEEQKKFVGSDNAFFSPIAFPESGGMFFYLTNRSGDTSLDTDVIYHEYAHAVINELVGPDQSAVFSALNEGSADYFSSSFLDDPVMAEYAAKIFNSRNSFLRRTDNNNRWPYNVVGESHADGNIWSGALWDVRARLGADVTDEIALNAIAMLHPDSEFFEAGSAAIMAAEELYGEHAAEIVADVMQSRGIYTSASRTASRSISLESGQTREGGVSAAAPGQLLVGAQQYRIDVPNRATRLLVRAQANTDIRFYLRYRVPITVEDGYILAEQVSSTGTSVDGYLSLNNRPELQAGTYYIAVVNTAQMPAEYKVEVVVDGGDYTAPPAVTLLESGATSDGSVPSGPFLASRQFAVQVPEGTGALEITLEGDADVDLYLRLGKPVRINGSGFPEADLVSESPLSREDLRVVGKEGGMLPAGTYFLGVYNYSSQTATFTVRTRLESGTKALSSELRHE